MMLTTVGAKIYMMMEIVMMKTKVTNSVADTAISGVENFMGNKNETTSARPKHVKLFCKFMRAIFVCATLDSFSVSFFLL